MKTIFLSVSKMSVLFYVLLAFFGCTSSEVEVLNENGKEKLNEALVTRSANGNDTIIANDGTKCEIVDGITLSMSITAVMANVTKLYGIARYSTVNSEGNWIERAYPDQRYAFDFLGRHLYEGKNPYIEETLDIFPEDGLCIPTDGSDISIILRLQVPSPNSLSENESEVLYIRYILSYINDEYCYGKLVNNGGNTYDGSIVLPINSMDYGNYIYIDDFRISDSSGQFGPRFW